MFRFLILRRKRIARLVDTPGNYHRVVVAGTGVKRSVKLTMLTDKQCKQTFGKTREEVEKQLTRVSLFGFKVSVHSKVADAFKRVNDKVMSLNLDYKFKRVETYCWRYMRGKEEERKLSKHSFAIAVDINPDENPFGTPLRTDIPDEVVLAFNEEGFIWGGSWKTPDTMHFEYAKIV